MSVSYSARCHATLSRTITSVGSDGFHLASVAESHIRRIIALHSRNTIVEFIDIITLPQ
jgi:hypothetical protein